MAIRSETTPCLHAYLEGTGLANTLNGLLFRPMSARGSPQPLRRQLSPTRVDWVLRKFGKPFKLEHDYSGHSMRTSLIMTALEIGAKLEDVQRTIGHADRSTTQLYNR